MAEAVSGQRLKILVSWSAKSRLREDYSFFVHLLDANLKSVAQYDQRSQDLPMLPMDWIPGEPLLTEHSLDLPIDADPGLYQVIAGAYKSETLERLPLNDENTYLRLGWIKVRPPKDTRYRPQRQISESFDRGISLSGYDLSSQRARTGDSLSLTLYWRAESQRSDNLSVFAHLVDGAGRPVAQHDGLPANGGFPTWIWEAGDTIVDRHQIDIPPDLAPGDYRLLVGLYNPTDGRRVLTANGQDSQTLTTVTVFP